MCCVHTKILERKETKNYDQMKEKNATKKYKKPITKQWQVNKLPLKLESFHVFFKRENSNLN